MVPLKSGIHFIIFFIIISILSFTPKVYPSDSDSESTNSNDHNSVYFSTDDESRNPNEADVETRNQIEAEMQRCEMVLRKYCSCNFNDGPLTALKCVQGAITYFDETKIPDGIMKDYFLSYTKHRRTVKVLSRKILAPKEFCKEQKLKYERSIASSSNRSGPLTPYSGSIASSSNRPEPPTPFSEDKCRVDLKDFKTSKEEAVAFAINKTHLGYYSYAIIVDGQYVNSVMVNQNANDYLIHIHHNVTVKKKTIQDPMKYCHNICHKSQLPLNLSQYMPF